MRLARRFDGLAVAFGLVAVIAAIFAFVGLSESGFWIDELYTVHLIAGAGSIGEVFRRSLTDTQPGAYYLLLWAWSRLAGVSEASLRLLSAILAVAALGVFAVGLRRVFRPAAVAFATALAATSAFWFEQSQNARNYALALLLASSLLALAVALRGRIRLGQSAGWTLPALVVTGLAASLCHSYLLLATGMVFGWLIVSSLRRPWLCVMLAIAGVAILAVNVAYVALLMRSSQQDLHDLWFDNTVAFYARMVWAAIGRVVDEVSGAAVVGLLLVLVFQARAAPPREEGAGTPVAAWTGGLCGFAILGVVGAGILVSATVAPSLSERNLLTVSPFAWGLCAWLYDRAGPRGVSPRALAGGAVLLLLVGANLALLRGRFTPRTEAWRTSARYVQDVAGCAGRVIPVIQPFRFGPSTPPFRALAERSFYGAYMPANADLRAYLPSEFAGRRPRPELSSLLVARSSGAPADGCPVLAWGVHDLHQDDAVEVAEDLLRLPGFKSDRIALREFDLYRRSWLSWRPIPSAWVFLATPPAANGGRMTPPASPPETPLMRGSGRLVVVERLFSYAGRSGPPYGLDGFGVQRWRGRTLLTERFSVVRHFTCDPPMRLAKIAVWPDLRAPGCSVRPLGAEFAPPPAQ